MYNPNYKKENNMRKSTIIFSVCQSSKSEDVNRDNTSYIKGVLIASGIAFTEVIGAYDGICEAAFVVDYKHQSVVQECCELYNQECYLIVDAGEFGTLVYTNDHTRLPIGRVRRSKKVPNTLAWTYNPNTEYYYYFK